MSCGGRHLHIATLMRNIHGVWAHPLALILWCQLLKQFWRMDGRTWRKRCVFGKKNPFCSDRSKLDGYFRTLGAFFRTSDAVRTALSKKRYVWRKKGLCMFALYGQIFQGQVVTKIEQCTRMSASASKNQSKEDRNHGIKYVNENQYFGNLCSCIFKQPKQNGTCNNELQVGNVAHLFDFHSFSCTSTSEHH